ncbi:TetR/AcrR family transcriptional regulator [Streptomyces sp. NBC_01314]|uniref:TetR/AcrR family transcriptional regulator n=1 Tax=Streptomyces sp. NBC_01314 TaxID=2903821 RepID=UPI00308EA26E|nr:TetR/AcrR family transcriptional regulator [Streptomyces sp. NBC_01314]
MPRSPHTDDMPGPRAQARRYVLSAAATALAENPGASMTEIASASGIGRATMYRWFATREQLVEAIHAHVVAEVDELMARRLRESGPALDVLLRLSGDIMAFGDRYRFLIASSDRRQNLTNTVEFKKYVADRQQAGELRGDLSPEWLVAAYGGLVVAALDQLDEQRLGSAAAGDELARTIVAAFSRETQ